MSLYLYWRVAYTIYNYTIYVQRKLTLDGVKLPLVYRTRILVSVIYMILKWKLQSISNFY